MLFRLLKLFGLDVPAEIEAVKANIALRVEQAGEHVKASAQQAGVIAALSAIAAINAAIAIAVGIAALCVWVAEAYGMYAALATGGGITLAIAVIFGIVAAARARAFAAQPSGFGAATLGERQAASSVASAASAAAPASSIAAAAPAVPPRLLPPPASSADFIEPMTFFLSRYARIPTFGNPALDKLVGDLRGSAGGTVHEAIDRAADVVRTGDRANLLIVLSGAAFAGWLLARQTRR